MRIDGNDMLYEVFLPILLSLINTVLKDVKNGINL